jgi:hypothetical protein
MCAMMDSSLLTTPHTRGTALHLSAATGVSRMSARRGASACSRGTCDARMRMAPSQASLTIVVEVVVAAEAVVVVVPAVVVAVSSARQLGHGTALSFGALGTEEDEADADAEADEDEDEDGDEDGAAR